MTAVEATPTPEVVASRARIAPSRWRAVRRALRRNPTILIGGALLVLLIAAAVLAPVLAPANPTQPGFSTRVRPPAILGTASGFVLGSDNLGRDILSRLLYGAQFSLMLAGVSVVLSGLIGVTAGLISGYVGGRTDDIIMRVVDVQLAFPIILLAIAIVAVVGRSFGALIGVLALSGWVIYARTVRANVLSLKELDYVGAARALGAGDGRIVTCHILPNTLAPIIVVATVQLATMLLLESGLSFLGLGLEPPTPSWGRMLAEGRDYLSNAWWISTMPGIAISLAVLGANLLGDGIRDLLDPNLRGM
ncbi:MAG: ABC transporter permease [Chloroflexi bacterium]|nr:ABC transporter permease [Chloroflexota bacterium]